VMEMEEYWRKWEEEGVMKDMSKEIREGFSGAEVKLKIEKNHLRKKRRKKKNQQKRKKQVKENLFCRA